MREIEFRAKDENNNWIYGSLIQLVQGDFILTTNSYNAVDIDLHEKLECNALWEENDFKKVNSKTIGQYTELNDKNGKKIFEGDIVKLENGFHEGLYNYVEIEEDEYYAVYYDEEYARYDLQTTDNNTEFKRVVWYQLVNAKVEVIGNIYDNPELLGE